MKYVISHSCARLSSESSAEHFFNLSFDAALVELYGKLGLEPPRQRDNGQMLLALSTMVALIPDLEIKENDVAVIPYVFVTYKGSVVMDGATLLFFVVSATESDLSHAESIRLGCSFTWRNTNVFAWQSEQVEGIDEVIVSCLAYWAKFFPLQALSALPRLKPA